MTCLATHGGIPAIAPASRRRYALGGIPTSSVKRVLIRPDAHIAWAATIDEPVDTAALTLREALSGWFGTPLEATAP